MEGVDQYATVVTPGLLDNAQCLGEVAGIGPGHELQVRVQAVLPGQIAQLGEVRGQA
ncbi:hypothetical protein D3C76_1079780 [compost metagenome]